MQARPKEWAGDVSRAQVQVQPQPWGEFQVKTLQVCVVTIQTCSSWRLQQCPVATAVDIPPPPSHCDGSLSLVGSLARNLSVFS